MSDSTYGPKVYRKQGGNEMVVASGGTLTIEPGGILDIDGLVAGLTHGQIFFVDSVNGSNSNDGTSWAEAVATVDYAVGLCTANRGDLIVVAPAHAETIDAAGDITLDVAGVTIWCLGHGDAASTFTFDGSDATPSIVVSASDCAWRGGKFVDNEASLAHMFDISGDDFTIEDAFFTEGSATGLFFIVADTGDGDSDRLAIRRCRFYAPTAGNMDAAIQLGKDHVGVRIEDCDIYGDFDNGGIEVPAGGNACLDLAIRNCRIVNLLAGAEAIDINGTTCTGEIVDCRLGTDALATAINNGSLRCHNVTWADTTDQVGAVPVFPDQDSANNILGADDADNGFASTNVAANRDGSIIERIEYLYDCLVDDEATNFIGVDDANNTAATTNVVANADGSILERLEYVQTDMLALPRCVEKSDGAVLSGDDPLFDITGGPIEILSIVGIVTTQIGAGTTNVKLQLDTTTPAATVELNAGAVDIDADAAGTSYRSINTTGVFTPVTAGFVLKANSFATNDTTYLAPIGQIVFNSDAARAGVIKWYLTYRPLSPNSRVAAAA